MVSGELRFQGGQVVKADEKPAFTRSIGDNVMLGLVVKATGFFDVPLDPFEV